MKRIVIAAVAVLLMAGCGGRANPLPGGSTYASSAVAPTLAAFGLADETSILKLDKKQVVIGSTIDPKYHQLNPYGLAVASKTSRHLTKGDLVVCNFNDKQNVQGTGFTIVALHPAPGSRARLIAADKTLTGCAALALDSLDVIWATAFSANDDVAFLPKACSNGITAANHSIIRGGKRAHHIRTCLTRHFMRATPQTERSCGSSSMTAPTRSRSRRALP